MAKSSEIFYPSIRSNNVSTRLHLSYSLPRAQTFYDGLPIGLGVLPSGTSLTYADYQAYEEVRRNVLCQPHGRAALMHGGIIWRLAQDSICFEHALTGPMSSCARYAFVTEDGMYTDDALTPQELDIIVGLYRIKTRTYLNLWQKPCLTSNIQHNPISKLQRSHGGHGKRHGKIVV